METVNLEQLADLLWRRYAERGRVMLALDGRCASGKTTSALILQEQLAVRGSKEGIYPQTAVLHLDDFFLRPGQRTQERLRIPGENVDHERFLEEALKPLVQGQPFSYRPYDCRICSLQEPVAVPKADIAVIEGVYSCHRCLREYYDLRVFADIDPETQRRRLIKRGGPAGWQRFAEMWIPLEELYFADLSPAVFDYRLQV